MRISLTMGWILGVSAIIAWLIGVGTTGTIADKWIAAFICLVVVALYGIIFMLPTLIAEHRKHHNLLAIFLVNILLGWLGIGWIVALIWSTTAVRRSSDEIVRVVITSDERRMVDVTPPALNEKAAAAPYHFGREWA